MATEYSTGVCKELERRFKSAELYRPMRTVRYEPGTELSYTVQSVTHGGSAQVRLLIEKFIGGGFAGQVYKVKLLAVETQGQSPTRQSPYGDGEPIEGLQVGQTCAVKILIPPSGFSRLFRDLLYWIGFQGPFQQQVNPAAARAGALWQKFIRRGAKIRFGDERAVVDIYGMFVDERLGSCGELREWVEGRTWRLEVDDRMDILSRWRAGERLDESAGGVLGSPEYRAKRVFMREFVELLHNMGAYEFARQYEWWTCKSQPNCLKRSGTNDDPQAGLVAVDFRAGLTLLPFLPMSPGDFLLIARGIKRGSLIQFDRGDIRKLETFVHTHADEFADMQPMLEELKTIERIYRRSIPDLTHNHVRLLYDGQLWSMMLASAVTGWQVRNLLDEQAERKLRNSKAATLMFCLLGLVPILGKIIRRVWGRADWRGHYAQMMTSWGYLGRAIRGRIAEKLIAWHRAGRIDERRAGRLAEATWEFLIHLPFSILPAGLHRMLTDWQFAKQRLLHYTVRPIRLYFNAPLREQWLRDMLAEGHRKHMLSQDDEQVILSQLGEPFIQKYLKSLAVHVCTLPVTQMVSFSLAIIYVLTHPQMPREQVWAIGLGIIALFQVIPISPGSLVRGLYVVYLVISERNFRDYNIAVFLGFFKYVGYLAFPIQMTYRYPALARFMAAHWATEFVHIVPVFGERGALLEHWVFCLFYNWPLTIRRRMRRRADARKALPARFWHVGLCALGGAALLGFAESIYVLSIGELPRLGMTLWSVGVLVPVAVVCGAAASLGCGGAALWKRLIAAAVGGALLAALYGLATVAVQAASGRPGDVNLLFDTACLWSMFIFAILAVIGAIITELKLPDPA
jgi:hypothetical protein